jgi:cyclophilin family peptidyl-prolyl cis-trans isomerase
MKSLPEVDRARLDLTLKRIGAPGAPALLPPELETPSESIWLRKAKDAKTPQERFTALHFLNRLKSKRAFLALEGLTPADEASWPRHLHLENAVARARLTGCEVSNKLREFLAALEKAGKTDPVRAQAARLRLVLAGMEKDLLAPVDPTPGAVLALLDAWNTGPWGGRKERHLAMLASLESPERLLAEPAWKTLGLSGPPPWVSTWVPVAGAAGTYTPSNQFPSWVGALQRLLEGIPDSVRLQDLPPYLSPGGPESVLVTQAEMATCARLNDPWALPGLLRAAKGEDPRLLAALLPALRAISPQDADALRNRLLDGPDSMARGYAVEDIPAAPADMEPLLARIWKAEELDGVQALLGRLDAWKLSAEKEAALLRRLASHPSWTARGLAYERLSKFDRTAPWPEAPMPTGRETKILDEAVHLVESGNPVRLRITFSGQRAVILRLDPALAPINAANLKLLAREGFFDGHTVARVVPDFVVQMGSPLDTMDGGPGYTVRCENSLEWYGPGSVGMALSGKDTGGSQFFITTNATPHLTGRYTRVGEVEDPDCALPLLDDLELGAVIERVEVLP